MPALCCSYFCTTAFTHLCQVFLDDIIPHLRRVQLCVESSSDHGHDVVDAAEAGLIGQQIPARAQKQGWKGYGNNCLYYVRFKDKHRKLIK